MKKINCPFCNSDYSKIIIEREFPSHSICLNCGFVYQNPIPDFEINKEFYSDKYWEEHHHYSGLRKDYPITDRQKRMLKWFKNVGFNEKSSILEVGCGFGFNLDYLNKNLSNNLEGLEISFEGSENVKKAFGINCIQSTLEDFESKKRYKGVILCHVLEHFENPLTALKKIHSLIEDDGYLWVEVPNILQINPKKRITSWLAKEHISYFSPEKLEAALIGSGYEIVKIEFKHYNCILAKKGSMKNAPVRIINEVNKVKTALIIHKVKYHIYFQLKRFGLDIFKNVKS